MKLQDALKKIIREFGMSVLREKRLVFLLSDYKAFDDYPAVKQIMKSIAEDGYGKELCRLGMDVSGEECLNYAGRLKKTLSGDKHFKPELADYAVDCILFSMGFVSSVREPSDHGFDPFGNGSASHEQDDLLCDMQRVHEKQFADTKSGGIHSAGTGSQAGRQSEAGARYSGSHAPSRDSSGSPVISLGIGRMAFWETNILCSLWTVGFFYLGMHSDGFLRWVLLGLVALGFLFCTIIVWSLRANDLGEAGIDGCVAGAFAYLSLIILAHFLQTWGPDILMHKRFIPLLVFSVAGGYPWIKYGFFKGRHS